ncbi:MAG TPA: alpha/beta hydrolase, partial [Microbacterium sp.]|nr:alpha/beta hydrolase [Microbacterium sp.]
IAALIRDRAVGGRAHVVGLSMGGVIGIHLAAGHPDVVRSCLVTGAAMTGVSDREARLARLQLRAWDRPWFWKLQAFAFRVPADSRQAFVEAGMGVSRDTAQRMYEEIFAGSLPEGRFRYDGPMLAIAGEKEPASVAAAFPALAAAMPQTRTWIAPKMRHVWSIQDAELFTRTLTDFADRDLTPAG